MKTFKDCMTQLVLAFAVICCATATSFAAETGEIPPPKDEPKIIDPGPVGGPPSDAIVLFDGKDLSKWKNDKGGEAKWVVEDGAATVNGTGSILTKEEFGDCQLHVEWATPAVVKGD